MNTATVKSHAAAAFDRLDAHFFTSAGVSATEQVSALKAAGHDVVHIRDIAKVWDPPRFARAYAAPAERGLPYLRPYDVFDYLPAAADRLSIDRNDDLERLQPTAGTLLQTCSGRNLGPVTMADTSLAGFALSHDMIRIEVSDVELRYYLLAYLKTATGQALLRRGKSGSVIDHITTGDVASVPLVLIGPADREFIAHRMREALSVASQAREQLVRLLDTMEEILPTPSRTRSLHAGWTVRRSELSDRLDAAFYDPRILAAQQQLKDSGGVRCGDLATAFLPVRYKRFYVESEHGRPILSGRQLLQFEPVNLRHVSDRSFRNPEEYDLAVGTTVFGAVGRSEGRQGIPALITSERGGWLASNDVMRLRPRAGVSPGALWLATAARQTRLQINALSFGSVIDHMNPWDVEEVIVPGVPDSMARSAEHAWDRFAHAAELMDDTVTQLQHILFSAS